MSTRNINDIDIDIEHLRLEGIDPRHRDRISVAVRQELERLIAEGGVPAGWSDGGVASIPRIDVGPGLSPARIGAHVAKTIYRGDK